jgi:hypothetical protein
VLLALLLRHHVNKMLLGPVNANESRDGAAGMVHIVNMVERRYVDLRGAQYVSSNINH